MIKYISPSGLKCFERDKNEFYLRYLAENRPPRSPQTLPMAIGSAFDVVIKNWIAERFGLEPKETFSGAIEEHVRDDAVTCGEHCFEAYKRSGALNSLLSEMKDLVHGPVMEFKLHGTVDGIPILGKPDLFFIDAEGVPKVIDWKVNGYARGASPKSGYVWLFDSWRGSEGPPSRGANAPHSKAKVVDGVNTVPGTGAWADQLSTYAWLLGQSAAVFGIDQLVGPESKIRVAKHRFRVSEEYQYNLLSRYRECWQWCLKERDERLEEMAAALASDDDFSSFVNQVSR